MIVDAHVHFWDPGRGGGALHYPWLDEIPALHRPFLPSDYRAATGTIEISKIVFVEANCRPDEALAEVDMIERFAATEPAPRIAGIVAFADLARGRMVDALSRSPMVKGVRQNIQGQPEGFCLQRGFVEGVREVGRREFTFDLCATHDQLGDVVQLVSQCPETRFVLDHCGKPPIRDRRMDPWRQELAALAAHENVSCKISGLLTEDADITPYADWVVEHFGTERVMYGSDWPVLTLAGSYCDWYGFTQRFTAGWSAAERSGFYGDNAARVYDL